MVRNGLVRAEWQQFANPQWRRKRFRRRLPQRFARRLPECRCVASSAPAPAPPLSTTAPAAAPSTPSGCYPLSDEGTCYEPGEYCRDSDHGASEVAGDCESIICEDNDGWRWEPA